MPAAPQVRGADRDVHGPHEQEGGHQQPGPEAGGQPEQHHAPGQQDQRPGRATEDGRPQQDRQQHPAERDLADPLERAAAPQPPGREHHGRHPHPQLQPRHEEDVRAITSQAVTLPGSPAVEHPHEDGAHPHLEEAGQHVAQAADDHGDGEYAGPPGCRSRSAPAGRAIPSRGPGPASRPGRRRAPGRSGATRRCRRGTTGAWAGRTSGGGTSGDGRGRGMRWPAPCRSTRPCSWNNRAARRSG